MNKAIYAVLYYKSIILLIILILRGVTMKKQLTVFICAAMLLCSCGKNTENNNKSQSKQQNSQAQSSSSAYESQTAGLPSLKELYAEDFYVGTAVSPYQLAEPDCISLIKVQFNSMTCENEMKPDSLPRMSCRAF